jgi:hypothetical protein
VWTHQTQEPGDPGPGPGPIPRTRGSGAGAAAPCSVPPPAAAAPARRPPPIAHLAAGVEVQLVHGAWHMAQAPRRPAARAGGAVFGGRGPQAGPSPRQFVWSCIWHIQHTTYSTTHTTHIYHMPCLDTRLATAWSLQVWASGNSNRRLSAPGTPAPTSTATSLTLPQQFNTDNTTRVLCLVSPSPFLPRRDPPPACSTKSVTVLAADSCL